MIGNLKALGVALGAVFALGAVAASSASAVDTFTTSVEPAVVTASGTDNIFKITSPLAEFHCWNATFAGTVKTKASKEITIFPTYKGNKTEPNNEKCESSLGSIKFDMNGCDYDWTGNTTGEDPADKTGKKDATVSITCPAGKNIEITGPACTTSIHEQTPTEGGIVYTNGEEIVNKVKVKDVTITATVTGITYETKGVGCELIKLKKEANDSDLNGTITATCWEDKGNGKNPDEFVEGNACDLSVSES